MHKLVFAAVAAACTIAVSSADDPNRFLEGAIDIHVHSVPSSWRAPTRRQHPEINRLIDAIFDITPAARA